MVVQAIFEALSRWNSWGSWRLGAGIARDARGRLEKWLGRPEAIAICGVRRSGKSTLMRQLAQTLTDRGVPAADILFANFEDPAFLEHGAHSGLLDAVYDTWFEMMKPKTGAYLFFDEIQNVPEWARWARVRLDARQVRLVVSGSSSQLSEPEVATVLTGRNFTCTLWPLSFREFLRFRGLEPRDEADLRAQAPRIRQELTDYLRYGGMPEVVLAPDESVKEALLKQYFRDILFRDIVSRHEVRDVRALEWVAHHYVVNTGNQMTYNRVKNAFDLAIDQVRAYSAYLEEAHLVHSVPRFSPKTSVQGRAPRKVYAVDTGMRNAVSFRFSDDMGRLAETMVHNHLVMNEDTKLFYYLDRGECDFVVWRGSAAAELVQVWYGHEPEPPAREIDGLLGAMRAFRLREGTLVTAETEFDRKVGSHTIHAKPLWLWLWERGAR